MSNEYYLAEAELKIESICKQAKLWQEREESLIGTAKIMACLFGAVGAVLWLSESWWWVSMAVAAVLSLSVIPGARVRIRIRKERYEDQLERAISWRDSLKRSMF